MGKSGHESFSFVGKSNLHLLRKNTNEKSIKKRFREKTEKKGGKSEGESKEKSHFWRKWVRFLRRRWSSKGILQADKKTKTISNKISEKWNDLKDPAINIIEIPIEPGKKISKIFIKPTKSGIKAMITRYNRPSPHPERSLSWEGNSPAPQNECKKTQKKATEKHPERLHEGKRLNWSSETYESDAGTDRNSESLLKSALFVRQDVDKTVECAVLFEPSLPKDCDHPRRSDEINQRTAESLGQYGELNGGKDQILETFKTVSEPAWNDRKKILRQQQLKDNINTLLEQFMRLEAEDLLDFGVSQTKLTEVEKKFRKTYALGVRELSREVSPEILVNIKPFKEQVSEDFLTVNASSGQRQREGKKNDATPEGAAKAEERESRVEGKEVCRAFSKGADFGVAENYLPLLMGTSPQMVSITGKEGGGHEDYQGEVSLQLKYKDEPRTPTCRVWGVYKTFSSCKGDQEAAVELKEVGEKKSGKKKREELDREIVNEVLDNLDDTDHDLVFQKNISQFRKKISVMPRFEVANSSINAPKTQQKKLSRAEHPRQKISETFRFEHAEPWKPEEKLSTILENICLLLSETELLSRALAARIEVGTLNCLQTAREVRDMVESHSAAVVKKVVPARFGEQLREVELRGVERAGARAGKGKGKGKGGPPVATLVAVHRGGFCGRVCTVLNGTRKPERSFSDSLKFFPNSSKCYYILPEYWFHGVEQKHETNSDGLRDGVILNGMSLTKSKDAEKEALDRNEEEERDVERRTETKLEFCGVVYEPTSTVVQVLNSSSCNYGIIIYESEFSSLSASSSSHSETGGNVEKRTSSLNFLGDGEETRKTESQKCEKAKNTGRASERRLVSESCFDGFQIIYNNSKDSLNDDEEDTAKVVFIGSPAGGKRRSFIFATGESENKITEKKNNPIRCSYEKPRLPESLTKKASRALTYKSSSSPRENITQTEFLPKEHRPRRSLIFSREIEKDYQNFKKRRLSLDKGVEVRRTGSVISEKDRPFLQKNSSFGKETFRSLLFPEELKTVLESERKGVERKMIVLDNGGANVKKEIFAAFNSIKEMNAGKGEAKGGKGRMSLVIMLSKK